MGQDFVHYFLGLRPPSPRTSTTKSTTARRPMQGESVLEDRPLPVDAPDVKAHEWRGPIEDAIPLWGRTSSTDHRTSTTKS
jgi:hypothetical protein